MSVFAHHVAIYYAYDGLQQPTLNHTGKLHLALSLVTAERVPTMRILLDQFLGDCLVLTFASKDSNQKSTTPGELDRIVSCSLGSVGQHDLACRLLL